MDTQSDFPNFKALIARLCATMGQFCTDELVESWWKALKNCDYKPIETNIDNFLARADEGTKFPRPAQMRPKGMAPPVDGQIIRNHVRDFWRSQVVKATCTAMSVSVEEFERELIADREILGWCVREVLNEVCAQENGSGARTAAQFAFVTKRAEAIARTGKREQAA